MPEKPRYPPDPSVHDNPKAVELCPYCHPERVRKMQLHVPELPVLSWKEDEERNLVENYDGPSTLSGLTRR